jgi:hypothetical protein
VLIADRLSRRITCQSVNPILNPPFNPAIPLSRYPAIPLSRYPAIPLSRYPAIPLSRYREIPPSHHPAIAQFRTIPIVNPISAIRHPDPQSLNPQPSM